MLFRSCSPCKGEGRIIKEVSYPIEVPAGIDSGQTLRLTGKGAVGQRGGSAGDLFVHMRVADHDMYQREDDDLVTDIEVSIAQAALGSTIHLPTLDGDEVLDVPSGTQHGREFVLKGQEIGKSGGDKSDSTSKRGNSEDAHLHFELKKDGSFVDPSKHINKNYCTKAD